MCGDAICGGGHLSHFWTDEEVVEHLKREPCIDCYCGIPMKRVGMVEYRYVSCPVPVGVRCKKHGCTHKPGSGIWMFPKDTDNSSYANKEGEA